MELNALSNFSEGLPSSDRMPVLFTSHGNPMEMLSPINATPFWKSIRDVSLDIQSKYKINAVLVVSAHWCTRGTYVNVADYPETIYDFTGFPAEFYKAKYPAPGSPKYASEVSRLTNAKQTTDWGYDHGSWPVLRHFFPDANVPVFQMSIDYYQSPEYHYQLAQQLKPLREKGVLIIGSGSVVHNLRIAIAKMSAGDTKIAGWEPEFDNWVKDRLDAGDVKALVDYPNAKLGMMAAPTPDHYVPMIYALGLMEPGEQIQHTFEEILPGFSNRGFRIG